MYARWRTEHGEPPTDEAVWDLHRMEQSTIAAETLRMERAEAEAAGEAPIPPSMVKCYDSACLHWNIV